jgi:beta-glucosidase
MRAHGAAVQALRADGCRKIGLVVNIEPKEPASDSPRDAAATDRADLYMNRIFLDAALLGRYPAGIEALFGDAWPETPAADLDLIRQPLDFIGVNYYTRSVVRDDPSVPVARAAPVRQTGVLHTDLGWEVHPPGLTRTLLQIKERYGGMPLYVTENGAAFPDPPQAAGTLVEDPLRVEYYRSHLAAAREAIRGGVDLRGYFAWSLMDNLEWASGFSKRFGLVHVDFKTQRRTPKSSAHFYGEVIRSRGRSLGGPPAP